MVSLRLRRATYAVAIGVLVTISIGCEEDGSGSTDAPVSSAAAPGVTVTGRERLTWDQEAASKAEVDSFRFTVFVDGSPAGLMAAACSASGAGSYACSASLPSLTPGTHRLAIQTTDPGGVSSPVSADLAVVMQGTGMSTSFVNALANALPLSIADVCLGSAPTQRCFQLERVATQLTAPAHPTELADGRLMLVDDGRLMELEEGRVRPAAVGAPSGSRVADISVPADSAATREVYLLEVSPKDQTMSVADVVRYRVVNGVFGERAVIVPDIAVPRDENPVLSVDEQILVGIPQQGDQGGRRLGTLLRYDRRGASAGYRVGTPVLAWGSGQPTSLFKTGESVAMAGLSTGEVAFGLLQPGATAPTALAITDPLAEAGGVRAMQRVGDLVLIATGDGTLQMGAADGQTGMPVSLQRLDTRGVVVTGLEATRAGGVVATAMQPTVSGVPTGVVFRATPVSARN